MGPPLGKMLGKGSAKTDVFNNKLLNFGKAYIPLQEFLFLPLQMPMSLLSSPHGSRHFAQASLPYQEDIPLQVCGCTAVCILQHPDYDSVWVANLGDSKAVLLVPGAAV